MRGLPTRLLGNPEQWYNPGSSDLKVVAGSQGGGGSDVLASKRVLVSDMAGATSEEQFLAALSAAPYVIVDIDVTIGGDVVVTETSVLDVQGGSFTVDGTLWIQGAVIAPHVEVFTVDLPPTRGTEKLKFFSTRQPGTQPKINEHLPELPAVWFNSDTDDWGERINKAIRCGGSDTVIRWSPTYGDWNNKQYSMVKSTIDFDQDRWYSHQTLRGSSHIGASLCIDSGLPIVGIDASNSRELMLDCVRLIQASGGRTAVCCAGGGTTLRIQNCWFGNAKYGYIQNKGAGTDICGLSIESCDYNMYISGSLEDPTITGFPTFSSVRRVVVRGYLSYDAKVKGTSVIRGNGYGVDGVAFVGHTGHYMDVPALKLEDTQDGTMIVSFTGCYLRDVPLSEVGPCTVQWVASMVKDADSPNGRETLLP